MAARSAHKEAATVDETGAAPAFEDGDEPQRLVSPEGVEVTVPAALAARFAAAGYKEA